MASRRPATHVPRPAAIPPARSRIIALCCATLCAAACGAPSARTDTKAPLPPTHASAPPSASAATDASAVLPDASDDRPYSPPPSPAIITVTTVKVPSAIVLDGDPGEFGRLDVIPPARVDGTRQGSGLSRVGLALDEKAIHLVGTIGGDARSGLTIALRFGSSEVPEVGYAQRGGGLRSIGDCSQEVEGQTPPVDECRAIYAAHDKFRAAHAARFTRVFHVSDSGITADDAALSKVVAAGTFKSKPTPTGFTFEAELPVAALPRTASVPIVAIDLAAGVGSAPPSAGAFVANSLPAPVSFEPYRAIRDLAFQFASASRQPRAVTYQPGDWNKVEIVQNVESGLSLEATERALYTKLAGEGDVEFGLIHIDSPIVISVKAGVPDPMRGFCYMREPPTKALKKRLHDTDGWLMVTSYNFFRSDMGYGQYVGFDTCFAAPDGSLQTELWPRDNGPDVWERVTPKISPDLETLTMSGTAYPLDLGSSPKVVMRPLARAWRLDKKTGQYVTSP